MLLLTGKVAVWFFLYHNSSKPASSIPGSKRSEQPVTFLQTHIPHSYFPAKPVHLPLEEPF